MAAELPSISSTSYASNAVNMAAVGHALVAPQQNHFDAPLYRAGLNQFPQAIPPTIVKEPKPMASTTRLVQVFIADTNDNIPLDKRLLYSGEQKLTDLTDQELFFEVDIKSMLDKHNEVRKGTVDKAVKERTEYLEAARIRDLKMTVVTIALF